jgi:hypothetical protein
MKILKIEEFKEHRKYYTNGYEGDHEEMYC